MNKGKYLLFLLENGIILDYGNKESERKRMNAYTDFATVYDLFMEEVPYDQWLSFLEEIWQADKWGHDAEADQRREVIRQELIDVEKFLAE